MLFPTIRFKTPINSSTIYHEFLHIIEQHPITAGIISTLGEPLVKASNQEYKKLYSNLSLSIENFAEQYSTLKTLLKNPDHSKEIFNFLHKDLYHSGFLRPGGNHISPYESYVASENITKMLEAEKK